MKATSLNFDAAMAAGERPIPIVYFSNAYGVRIWSTQYPPRVADAEGDEHLADGTWKADGSIRAGSNLGGILERAGRLIEISPLEEGNPDASLEESQSESDAASLSVVVENEGLPLSVLEAEENVLSALVRLVVIHPGSTDWNDRLDLGDFRVAEYTLERERLTLECEAV